MWNECSQLNNKLGIYNACYNYTTLKKEEEIIKTSKQTKNELYIYNGFVFNTHQ